MISEKTITICGKEVNMRYCAATETGFENLASGKTVEVFIPTVAERNEDGTPKSFMPPKAATDDYIKLAIASIIAAYSRNEEEPPITSKDIIYDAEPEEVNNMIKTVIELRNQWYNIPASIKPETKETEDKGKNVHQPATSSKLS